MNYLSTRNTDLNFSFSQALLMGRAEDGGYFVPETLPSDGESLLDELAPQPFLERMATLLRLFIDELNFPEALRLCRRAFPEELFPPDAAAARALNPYKISECGLFLNAGPSRGYEDYYLSLYWELLQQFRPEASAPLLCKGGKWSGLRAAAALASRLAAKAPPLLLLADRPADSRQTRRLSALLGGGEARLILLQGESLQAERLLEALSLDENRREIEAAAGTEVFLADSSSVLQTLTALFLLLSGLADLKRDGLSDSGKRLDLALPLRDMEFLPAALYAKAMGLGIDKIILVGNRLRSFPEMLRNGRFPLSDKPSYGIAAEIDRVFPGNLERLLFELSGRQSEKCCAWRQRIEENRELDVSREERLAWQEHLMATTRDEKSIVREMRLIYDGCDYLLETGATAAFSAWRQLRPAKKDISRQVLCLIDDSPLHGLEAATEALFGKGYIKGRKDDVAAQELAAEAGLTLGEEEFLAKEGLDALPMDVAEGVAGIARLISV